MLRNTNTHSKAFTIFLAAIALLAALSIAGCKNDSVVSNGDSKANPAATPATSQLAAAPSVEATPASLPTAPVGPVGPAGPAPGAGDKEGQREIGNIPLTTSKAKPALTPDPDPFPPRPTPAVVMKNGKIAQPWQAPEEAASLVNPVKSKPDAAKIGRDLYMQKCVDCHGKSGQGNGWMSNNTKRDGKTLPPTNLTSQVTQANTDGELFWKITNGRSPMPAHRVRFEDEQRWYIVSFLRTLKK